MMNLLYIQLKLQVEQVMVFCFVQNFFFGQQKAQMFSPEFNIKLYDKNSESDFFSLHPKSEYFFQQHWESEYFLEKKNIPPPWKLNGPFLAGGTFLLKFE